MIETLNFEATKITQTRCYKLALLRGLCARVRWVCAAPAEGRNSGGLACL
jgi:hypothetical protein